MKCTFKEIKGGKRTKKMTKRDRRKEGKEERRRDISRLRATGVNVWSRRSGRANKAFHKMNTI